MITAPPLRRGTTALPDGRRLGWGEWGPEEGAVVLYCPGAGMSARLGFGGALLDEREVRLIAIERPGLGRSDPAPGRTLSDFVEDVRALIAARGLGTPSIVGFSAGAPFALACAAAGVVSSVAVVSGTDELASAASLVPEVRALIERVGESPAEAEAYFAGMSAETLLAMVTEMSSEDDRAVYGAPAFTRAYAEALTEGFAQGAAGYARDTVLSMSPWPFELSRIAAPVALWYGERDASPVHSPDRGASLCRRIPGAHRHLLDAGGALLWTHARAILTSLLEGSARRPG